MYVLALLVGLERAIRSMDDRQNLKCMHALMRYVESSVDNGPLY